MAANQLLGDPLSIQQIMEFFCDVLNVLPCGIRPVDTAERMAEEAPEIWLWLVKAPGPLVLPAAWQPETAQTVCIIGLTSAAKALLVTVLQLTVPPPPPPPPPPVSLLQLFNVITDNVTRVENFRAFFIIYIL